MVYRTITGADSIPAPSPRQLAASRAWAWDNAHASAEWLRPLLPVELRRVIGLKIYLSHDLCNHRFAPCETCGFHCCVFCRAKYNPAHRPPLAIGLLRPTCTCPPFRRDPSELLGRIDNYEHAFAQDVPAYHRLFLYLFEGLYAAWSFACVPFRLPLRND